MSMEHSIQTDCDNILESTNINDQYNSSTDYYINMIKNIFPDNIDSATSSDTSTQKAPIGIRFIKKNESNNAASAQTIVDSVQIRESLKSVDVEFYRAIEESPFKSMQDSPYITKYGSAELVKPTEIPQLPLPPPVVSYADLIGKLYSVPPPPTSQSTPEVEKSKPIQYFTDIILRVSEQDRRLVNDCYSTYRHRARLSNSRQVNNNSISTPVINVILETIANIKHIIKIDKMLRGDFKRSKLLYDTFSVFKVKPRRIEISQSMPHSQQWTQQNAISEYYNYDADICEEMYLRMFRYQLRSERDPYVYNFNQFVQALECADAQYMDIIYSTKVNRENVISALEELKWSMKCSLYYLAQFIRYFDDPTKNTDIGYDHVLEIFSRISSFTYSFLDYMAARDRPIVDACSAEGTYVLRTIKYQGWNLYATRNQSLASSSSMSNIRSSQTPASISDILWPDYH